MAEGTDTSKFIIPGDSKFYANISHMSETEIYQKLGYGHALKTGGLDEARKEFKQDHPQLKIGNGLDSQGAPTKQKLDGIMQQAIEDKEKFARMGATGITTQQAYGIRSAGQNTHVPETAIARLAIAERAFDKHFLPPGHNPPQDDPDSHLPTAVRHPGLIQMEPNQWMDTVKASGNKFPGTRIAQIAAELNRPENAKLPLDGLSKDLRDRLLKLRDNPLYSAEIGAEYAKTHPVHLDIMKCYAGTKAGGANAPQLGAMLHNMGIPDSDIQTIFDPKNPQWCALMANAVLYGGGDPTSATPGKALLGGDGLTLAGDFANYGAAVDLKNETPRRGDIVMWVKPDGSNNPYQHVALVSNVDKDKGTFDHIGGNQQSGHSSVNEETGDSYSSGTWTFRRPQPNIFAQAEAHYEKTLKAAQEPPSKPDPAKPAPAKPAPSV